MAYRSTHALLEDKGDNASSLKAIKERSLRRIVNTQDSKVTSTLEIQDTL